ncbi:hypothetical protein WN51_13060, partial [Melipona quadrifasciata]
TQIFLNENKINIFLISETHFTDRSYFNIYKYKTYHTNYLDGTAYGGTTIIINEKISDAESIKFEKVFLQSTSVEIKDAYNHISTGEPAYWSTDPRKTPDLLDFFIAKGISLSQVEVNSSTKNGRTIWKTYWSLYKALINDNINLKIPLKTVSNID